MDCTRLQCQADRQIGGRSVLDGKSMIDDVTQKNADIVSGRPTRAYVLASSLSPTLPAFAPRHLIPSRRNGPLARLQVCTRPVLGGREGVKSDLSHADVRARPNSILSGAQSGYSAWRGGGRAEESQRGPRLSSLEPRTPVRPIAGVHESQVLRQRACAVSATIRPHVAGPHLAQ